VCSRNPLASERAAPVARRYRIWPLNLPSPFRSPNTMRSPFSAPCATVPPGMVPAAYCLPIHVGKRRRQTGDGRVVRVTGEHVHSMAVAKSFGLGVLGGLNGAQIADAVLVEVSEEPVAAGVRLAAVGRR